MGQINLFVGWILCLTNKRKKMKGWSESLLLTCTTRNNTYMDVILWGSQIRRSSILAWQFLSKQGWAGGGWGRSSTALSSTGKGFWMSASHLCCTCWGAAAACVGKNLHTCICNVFCIKLLHSKSLPFMLNQRATWQPPSKAACFSFHF